MRDVYANPSIQELSGEGIHTSSNWMVIQTEQPNAQPTVEAFVEICSAETGLG